MVNGNDMVEHLETCENCQKIEVIGNSLLDNKLFDYSSQFGKEVLQFLNDKQAECFSQSEVRE